MDFGRRFGENGKFGLRFGGELRRGSAPQKYSKLFQGAVSLAADYHGDRFRTTLDLFYQDTDADGNTREFFGTAVSPLPDIPGRDFNSAQPFSQENFRFASFLVSAEYDIASTTTVFARFGISDEDVVGAGNGPSALQSNGDFSEFIFGFAERNERQNFETGVRSSLETGPLAHEFVAAVSRSALDYSLGLDLPGSPGQPNNIFDFIIQPSPSLGPFSDDNNPSRKDRFLGATLANTISILDDRVQLTVGGRYQRIKSETFDGTTGEPTGDPISKEDGFSPGVGLLTKPLPWLSVYGNYFQALAFGGIAPLGTVNAGEALAPITSEQVEFGAKANFEMIGAELAFFQIDEPSAAVNPATNVFEEIGNARIRGVEATVFGEPFEGFRVLGGVTYLVPELTESADSAVVGNDLPGTPRLRGVVNAEYDTPFVDGLTLTGRFTFVGDAFQDTANEFEVDSYTRLDLGARYGFEINDADVTARLAVENVVGNRFFISSDTSVFAKSPRTVLFSLSTSF